MRPLLPTLLAFVLLAPPLAGCPTGDDDLVRCDGLTGDNAVDHMGGQVTAEFTGARSETFLSSGLLQLTDTGGGVVQLQLFASDEPAGKESVTTLVVDCYQEAPVADGVGFSAPIAEFAQATGQLQCWAWVDVVASDPVGGETAHYATDGANTGTFGLDATLELPGGDGVAGDADGDFEFDAMDSDGERLFVTSGHFGVPVCGP